MPVPWDQHLRLVAFSPEGELVKSLPLTEAACWIGSDPGCHLHLESPEILPHHATLNFVEDSWVLSSVNSKAPAFLQQTPVLEPTPLGMAAKITLGPYRLRFQTAGLSPETLASLPYPPPVLTHFNPLQPVVHGRTSTIYEATDTSINRTVAFRVLHPENQATHGDALQFIRDAWVQGHIPHPGVPPVFCLGLDPHGRLFSATRFVEGRTLQQLLYPAQNRETLPFLREFLLVFLKLCDCLGFAHSRGFLHCALHPSSITVGHFGEACVLSWMHARRIGSGDDPAPPAFLPPVTPYTAPELASGFVEDIGPATDIYALGAILHHILALAPPVSGSDPEALLENILTNAISPIEETATPPPSHWPQGKIPPNLAASTRKALASDPADRHKTVAELLAEVAAALAVLHTDSAKTTSNPFPLWKWK
jgi:serine/threonine protein kinase